MAVTDLSGTIWRANCLTIGAYDPIPDPTDEQALPFVNVIEAEEPNPGEVITPGTPLGLHVRYNDPVDGYMYVPCEDVPMDITVNPPWYDSYTYVVDENNGTILLTFNENLTLGSDYSEGNITWLETYAEQIIDNPVLPSFSDVEVTPHEGYITMTINGVDFNLKATIAYPAKGDLIRMTLGNETPVAGMQDTYRVLKIDGTIAEVVAMFDQSTSQTFGSSNTYAGSTLDTYLNTTWYGTLSADAKAAIVAKTFTQDSWYSNTSGDPDYNGTYGTSSTAYQVSLGSATYGAEITRNVYALSVQDVIDYLEVTSSMTTANTTLTAANVWAMFWNTTSQPSNYTYPRLRSADAVDSNRAFGISGNVGFVSFYTVGFGGEARPAFSIDLSKIEWSRVR